MVRSAERLDVTTVRVPTRSVRLEKYVVTETRTITVEVSHEQVRVVEIDLTADTADSTAALGGQPLGGGDRSGAGRWLTLSEERIDIVTTVVPVERVRLAVTSVAGTRTVTENIRREEIQLEPPTRRDAT